MSRQKPLYVNELREGASDINKIISEVTGRKEVQLKAEIERAAYKLFEGKNYTLVGVCNSCSELHRPEGMEEIIETVSYACSKNKKMPYKLSKKLTRKAKKIQRKNNYKNEFVAGGLVCLNYQQKEGENKKGVIITQECHLEFLKREIDNLVKNGSGEKIAETSLGPVDYHVYGFGKEGGKKTGIFGIDCRSMLKIPEDAVIRISDLPAIKEL
ncbi:MAG: hypothetical protein ABIE55_04720 [Candidatus Aenigmatarchaeota archaeon]